MPRLSSGIGDALPGSLKPVFGAGRRVFRSGHLFTDRGSGFGPIAAEAPATTVMGLMVAQPTARTGNGKPAAAEPHPANRKRDVLDRLDRKRPRRKSSTK